MQTPKSLLKRLNTTYCNLHEAYEKEYWLSYMWDKTAGKRMNKCQAARDAFRGDATLRAEVVMAIRGAKAKDKDGLKQWLRFFDLYQTPDSVSGLRKEIADIEAHILKIRGEREEGYIDPKSGKFVQASENKMKTMISTNPDEVVRKACFDALNRLPLTTLDLYVEVIQKRNEYARALGHEDFYAYKLSIDERMTKKDLFSLFDSIYEKTKYAFGNIQKLETSMPRLRKPWNFGYMMAGSFTKEEDPFFSFDKALMYWGVSFAALGIDMAGGTITLDLLDRKGKYNNGFCHWPKLVSYNGTIRHPGAANFTCTAIPGQIGSGLQGVETLFHEGGHAAHLLNSTEKNVCLNSEYPPQSTSWAETQSMFMDTISSSIEWKTRYATDASGRPYPFDLFERKIRKLHVLRPLGLMSMIAVCRFEKEIYESAHLTGEKVLEIARRVFRAHFERSEDYLMLLNIPHIYAWESSAYYHGYALAELGLQQWREYFYDKYGYIVDNPKVGKEMKRVWKYAARYSSNEFIKMATGKKLSPDAYLKYATASIDDILSTAKAKIARLDRIKRYTKPVDLNAHITLMHGKKKIADNSDGFESMAETYSRWLARMIK